MSETSTNHDIIKYIYNELEESKQKQLNIQTLIDPQTKNILDCYASIKKELDSLFLNPSDSVINKIKEYSLDFNLIKKNKV